MQPTHKLMTEQEILDYLIETDTCDRIDCFGQAEGSFNGAQPCPLAKWDKQCESFGRGMRKPAELYMQEQKEKAERARLDLKEAIAALIYDHEYYNDSDRPAEVDCHDIAEEILEHLGK